MTLALSPYSISGPCVIKSVRLNHLLKSIILTSYMVNGMCTGLLQNQKNI
jgi:hypothetical protein